jgi:hypothetical protein
VWGCGWNSGQLGDGTNFNKIIPVQASGLTGVTAIAGGGLFSLFVKSDGTAWACGYNSFGQLGDGTTVNRLLPVQVIGLSGIVKVAAGSGHSLFLKNDGTVWASGKNQFGALGDGTTTYANLPVQVQSLCLVSSQDVSIISGNIHTEAGIPVAGVTVTLSGDDTQTFSTDPSGDYSFTVAVGGTYTVTPSKNNDVVVDNGISSIDVLLMNKHILGITPLGSPYKIIAAAEVNADGNTQISSFDVLFTRQLILGQITNFPINRLWQFVSSDFVFADPTFPFPFHNSRTYISITSSQSNQNFIGIKLGDVNESYR